MSYIGWPNLAIGELLDYKLDWSRDLGTDTIASSSWDLDGLTSPLEQHDATSATLWIRGVTAGNYYPINTITTVGGREIKAKAFIRVFELDTE